MAANYPNNIYSPRTKENESGIVYDPNKKTIGYAEDVVNLDEEVVAIETELGTLPKWTSTSVKERLKGIRSLSDANQDVITIKGGNVGIGTTSPAYKLDVAGKIGIDGMQMVYLPDQTDFEGSLVIGDGGQNLSYTSGSDGHFNTFVGIGAGNANTTGSSNVASGRDALRSNTTGTNNTVSGVNALRSNTTGSFNTVSGVNALFSNTTGTNNVASGRDALRSNTTGSFNTVSGVNALFSNTTGTNNTVSGVNALFSNTTGTNNTVSGVNALRFNTTGTNNTASGYQAGRYIADGATANETGSNSLFLGEDTRALADGQTNQIVIGQGAIGIGSNSVVLGNDSIVTTALNGNVGIGTTSPKSKLHVVGLPIYANNAAAIAGGLTAGAFYRTGDDPDPVCVVH